MSDATSCTFTAKFQHVIGGSHVLNSGFDIPLIGLGELVRYVDLALIQCAKCFKPIAE